MGKLHNNGTVARSEGFMFTATGKGFDLLRARNEKPDLEDIAHALGMQCRFNGHTTHFYSVAQHCVNVAKLLKARGHGPEVQLLGLLHDAGEAYTGDISVPVQRAANVGEVKSIEEDILFDVVELAGLSPSLLDWKAVKDADQVMGLIEMRDLILNTHGMIDFAALPDYPRCTAESCMKPQDARDIWHFTYDRLQEGM